MLTTRVVGGELRLVEVAEPDVQLTPREIAVLELMAQGLATKQIAVELSIPIDTVRSRSKRVYRKLGVQNRVQAALAAYRAGFVG